PVLDQLTDQGGRERRGIARLPYAIGRQRRKVTGDGTYHWAVHAEGGVVEMGAGERTRQLVRRDSEHQALVGERHRCGSQGQRAPWRHFIPSREHCIATPATREPHLAADLAARVRSGVNVEVEVPP